MSPICRILIVEGNARSLITISSFLKDLGVSYKRNTTGKAVVEQAAEMQPDLIFLNMHLPDANAPALCQALKRYPHTAHIPVIATTETRPTEYVEWLEANGFSGCLCKPLSRQAVVQILEQFFPAMAQVNAGTNSAGD